MLRDRRARVEALNRDLSPRVGFDACCGIGTLLAASPGRIRKQPLFLE